MAINLEPFVNVTKFNSEQAKRNILPLLMPIVTELGLTTRQDFYFKNESFAELTARNHMDWPHCHRCPESFYILAGSIKYQFFLKGAFHTKEFVEGDFVYIGKYVPHRVVIDPDDRSNLTILVFYKPYFKVYEPCPLYSKIMKVIGKKENVKSLSNVYFLRDHEWEMVDDILMEDHEMIESSTESE